MPEKVIEIIDHVIKDLYHEASFEKNPRRKVAYYTALAKVIPARVKLMEYPVIKPKGQDKVHVSIET